VTNQLLSQYFSLNRRYSRSINLERDFELPDTIMGYILTERAVDALQRVLASITRAQPTRAWTLTGVHGTGKSAFAHYLTSLCAPEDSQMRRCALEIAQKTLGANSQEYQMLEAQLPCQGLLRAVAVGQREPLRHTIARALEQGANVFWRKGRKPEIVRQLVDWTAELEVGRATFTSRQVLAAVKEVAEAAKTDALLIIDELGKNLEFAAHNPGSDDLYLLQQLAELPRNNHSRVYIIGLLHQAFAEYSQQLASAEKNEWSKIQGRFEDIPFTESTEQMTRLIGQAINQSKAGKYQFIIHKQAKEWSEVLQTTTDLPEISPAVLGNAYPLHPIAARALPMLCTRYAQNDRSLFTFLTSSEPHSFANFLQETTVENDEIPTLKLHQIYDYFVESVASGIGSRPNLQRWIEIQDLVSDAKHLDAGSLAVLKTIGILNLISSTSSLRATRTLVKLALMNQVIDRDEQQHWEHVIENLLNKGLITYRKQLDELRVWEGSDFDVEQEISVYVEKERSPLAEVLTRICPLKPLIAQRHSYRTGTLRYFERQYLENQAGLEELRCAESNCDGLIGYWVSESIPEKVPAQTTDGKPFILLNEANLTVLRVRALEFAALRKIQTSATQLQTDGVARREVRHRLVQAKRLLDEALNQTFNLAGSDTVCWIQSNQEPLSHTTDFNAKLSEICDRVYHKTPILWNELINRRELTSQGAKARRELLEAMLERPSQERLGLEGYGPEVAMYYSVLGETGIHRQETEEWGFYPPHENAGVWNVWQAIERFCIEASEEQRSLNLLYEQLDQPPYGVKHGAIPILLAALLLYHVDDIGIYKDGTFIPVLGPEHFELLVKDPSRFSVKYFEIVGLRSQVFIELETVLKSPNAKTSTGVRNASLLAIAKPLFGFVRQLPEYTRSTKCLSAATLKVLQVLQTAQEPDELLFVSLPKACGFDPMAAGEEENEQTAKAFRKKLVQCIHEIQTAHDNLLSDCQKHLYEAFGVRSREANLREDLRVRASYLVGQCIDPMLRYFVTKAVEEDSSNRDWLEALVRIVADKHPKGWVDEDLSRFEIALSDLVRRFENLEALRTEIRRQGKGFDALRITVTEPNGQEVHEVVWIDEEHEELFDRLVEDVLNAPALKDNPRLQKGFLAKLNEKLLSRKNDGSLGELRKSKRKRGQSA